MTTYAKDPLPEGTVERLFYSWGQTASLELYGAWITQGNVQLGCARQILNNCPSAELRQLLENFISILMKALKAFKDIIQDYLKDPPKGKGKAKAEEQRKPLSYREFVAAAQVLWIGEEIITCAQNMYKVLLK